MVFNKFLSFRDDEAVAKKILSTYRHLGMCAYYDRLEPNISYWNKRRRLERLTNVTSTYLIRYYELIDLNLNHIIYDTYVKEEIRIVITRWRLSNHKLKIEIGRQEIPFVPRYLQVCTHCKVLEDEKHAIYYCSLYRNIRSKYLEFLQRYPSVNKVFNPYPSRVSDAIILGNFLNEIEHQREVLGLQ